jgi:hypothetical protein
MCNKWVNELVRFFSEKIGRVKKQLGKSKGVNKCNGISQHIDKIII